MKGIEYLILRIGLVLFLWLLTSPVVLVAILLGHYFESHEEYKNLQWTLLPLVFFYIIGVPWYANKTAQYMAFDKRNFFDARKCVDSDLKLRLAFLPLIGHWFAPKVDKKDDDGNA
jgi:hypothetical protein